VSAVGGDGWLDALLTKASVIKASTIKAIAEVYGLLGLIRLFMAVDFFLFGKRQVGQIRVSVQLKRESTSLN
jgi:hypothetical protein